MKSRPPPPPQHRRSRPANNKAYLLNKQMNGQNIKKTHRGLNRVYLKLLRESGMGNARRPLLQQGGVATPTDGPVQS